MSVSVSRSLGGSCWRLQGQRASMPFPASSSCQHPLTRGPSSIFKAPLSRLCFHCHTVSPLTWTPPLSLLEGLLWLFWACPGNPGKSLPFKILNHANKIPFTIKSNI